MRFTITLLLLCCGFYCDSQTIINRYAAVLSQSSSCANTFSVDDATGFGSGDTVLMIQMKGASIDSSNSASFGSIIAYNGAGSYELNVISAVSGSNISLLYKVVRSYDIPAGRVQFVRVPYYTNYTVSATHSCMPWNGAKGGVFAMRASGTITLNADIDVSGKGFAGGLPNNSTLYGCNKTDYYYPGGNNDAGFKGEGITTISASKAYGRGALANGGGGGNDHNAGGGGGSNAGSGGKGGNQFKLGSCNTIFDIGGLGGYALSYASAKFFPGGGGGCGQGNNLGEKAGGNGGGIIYIAAASLAGNGHTLNANGLDAPQCTSPSLGCQDDGGGGGGGGGVIYNTATTVTGALVATAHGGKGSNIYVSPNTTEVAPGGGGGGGLIAFIAGSYSSAVTFNATGGAAGVLPQFSNTNYGATAGSAGTTPSATPVPFPILLYTGGQITAAFTDTLLSCTTLQFLNTSTAAAGITAYKWDFPGGATSTLPNPSFNFASSGTYTVILTITDANGCTGSISRNVVIPPALPVSFTDSLISCLTRRFVNTTPPSGVVSYAWDFGVAGATSAQRSPTYTFPSPGTYTVKLTVTDARGCVSVLIKSIVVKTDVRADFSYNPLTPEVDKPVQFSNASTGATHYAWNFGDGVTSSQTSPSHTYHATGNYQVCLVASDEGGCADSICKNVAIDVPISIGVPSAFTPNGDGVNDVLLVKGAGITQLHLVVYNRWGQKVFESSSQDKGWDGTFNGQPQEIDLYAYVLSATFYNGSSITKKGNINLLR